MTITPTSELLENLAYITLIAVVVSSASGVLKAGSKQFDLFGVVIIGIATGLGGGSLRDLLLGREVFWVANQVFFIASLGSAIGVFALARLAPLPRRAFLIADAAGLATFSVAGTLVSTMAGAPWLVASFLGVMTGTMGGIFRDVLSNEPPMVFTSPLYATVAWAGSLLFLGLMAGGMEETWAALLSGSAMFALRLLAIRFHLKLPTFSIKR